MKTKHLLLTAMVGLTLTTVILTGCKKKDTSAMDTDTNAAQDDANATFAINDSKNIADGAAQNQANVERVLGSPCAVVTKRDTTMGGMLDSLLDINFGPTPCVCNDGKSRQGHVLVYWDHAHPYFTTGDTINMTFKGYVVNTKGITGLRSLVNIGTDSAGNMSWKFTANLTISYGGGGTATWSASRTNTLVQVGGAWYYQITGGGSGVTKNGVSYTHTINSAVYYTAIRPWNGGCAYPEQGTVTIARSNHNNSLVLNYTCGLGNCPTPGSPFATATINGNTFTIDLP